MKVDVLNLDAEKVGDIALSEDVFSCNPRKDIISRVINWQLAKRRCGNHKAKVRGEVSGSTKKIFKQKGTGNARHGSRRGAQFRGGGIIFGPLVRDHAHSLQKKVRKLGLKMALSAKALTGNLHVVENFIVDSPKVNAKLQGNFNAKKILFVDSDSVNVNFSRSISNVVGLDVLPQIGANVYDIVRKEKIVMTKQAAEALQERLS